MFRSKSREQVILEAVSHAITSSSISYVSPGGKARAIIEGLGQIIGIVNDNVSNGLSQSLLNNASGPILDLIAESHGLQRLDYVPPRIEVIDNNLKYYVSRGTFGDINNGQDIVIPKGTQITANVNRNNIFFIQREEITLLASQSSVYFAADQAGTAVAINIAPNTLTKHNFVGYASSPFGTLLISNEKGLAGRPPESDNNLRFRIKSQLTNSASGNLTAVKLAALNVPGVSDVRILPYRAGMGTFDVIVFGINPSVSTQLLQEVQLRVNLVSPIGSRAIVVAPRLVGISLLTSIRFSVNTPSSTKNLILAQAETITRDYINNLRPGQKFIINQLAQQILSISPFIINIGTGNIPFDELFIWKQSGPNSSRYSKILQQDYLIQEDEDLIAEPFIQLPIRYLEGN